MSFQLPENIQSLNSLTTPSPPSPSLVDDQTLWSFLNHDMFGTFSHQAAAGPSQPTPVEETLTADAQRQPTSLEQWASTFNTADLASTWPYPTPVLPSASSSTAPTPAAVKPLDLAALAGDKITGARKLKQLGMPSEVIQEDKRKRNTEASARFRQKKKEREQALEKHSKDLQAQVERYATENENLRQQNALLMRIIGLSGGDAKAIPEEVMAQLSQLSGVKSE